MTAHDDDIRALSRTVERLTRELAEAREELAYAKEFGLKADRMLGECQAQLTAAESRLRAAQVDAERLRHDIERHVAIAAEHATDAERWRFVLKYAWDFITPPMCERETAESPEDLVRMIDTARAALRPPVPDGAE